MTKALIEKVEKRKTKKIHNINYISNSCKRINMTQLIPKRQQILSQLPALEYFLNQYNNFHSPIDREYRRGFEQKISEIAIIIAKIDDEKIYILNDGNGWIALLESELSSHIKKFPYWQNGFTDLTMEFFNHKLPRNDYPYIYIVTNRQKVNMQSKQFPRIIDPQLDNELSMSNVIN